MFSFVYPPPLPLLILSSYSLLSPSSSSLSSPPPPPPPHCYDLHVMSFETLIQKRKRVKYKPAASGVSLEGDGVGEGVGAAATPVPRRIDRRPPLLPLPTRPERHRRPLRRVLQTTDHRLDHLSSAVSIMLQHNQDCEMFVPD